MKSFDELFALITQRGVHAVFGDTGEGWGIEQNAEELADFLLVCQELGVSSVLEIGTGYRAGLARFLNDDLGWQVTSVDIHAYGHSYSGITFITPVPPTQYAFNVGDFGQYDLVIIDADHSYDGVRNDHLIWGDLATKVIAFHDIAGLRDCEGVCEYWIEISRFPALIEGGQIVKNNAKLPLNPGYHEIIADGDQRGGIGYIVLAEVNQGNWFQAVDVDLAIAKADKPEPKAPVAKKPATPRKRKPAARKKPAAAKK